MTLAALHRPFAIVALLLSALALVACGESSEEKATAQVCDSREAISKQVTKLSSMTVSTTAVDEVKASVSTIGDELKKIKEAESDLNGARKEQVQAATQTFEKEVSSTVSGLTSNLSLSNAEAQLKAALSKLANSYKQTLAPISCP